MPQNMSDWEVIDDDWEVVNPNSSDGFLKGLLTKATTPLASSKLIKGILPFIAPSSVYHPKIAQIGADLASGMTTPLNIGMAALTGGESIAGKLGLQGLKSGLQLAGRAASTGIAGEGAYNIYEQPSLGGKAMGAVELVGGLAGINPKVTGRVIGKITNKELPKPVVEKEIPFVGSADLPLATEKPRLRITKEGLKPVSPEKSWAKLTPEEIKQGWEVVEPPKEIKPKFELRDGKWQPTTPKVEPEGLPKPSVTQLIKGEEGSFDPNAVTRKIAKALDKAASGPAKYVPNVPKPEEAGAIGKLFAAIDESKSLTEPQEQLRSMERARRIAAFSDIEVKDTRTLKKAMSKLKGEYPTLEPERLKLGQKDVNQLLVTINKSGLRQFEQVRAYTGLRSLLEGRLATPSELTVLEKAFGAGFKDAIVELHGGLGAAGGIGKTVVSELVNIPRTMKTVFDMSAPLRQGLGLLHRKEFRTNWMEMNKGLGSQRYYEDTMDAIYSKPLFKPKQIISNTTGETILKPSFAEEAGLKMTKMEDFKVSEEHLASQFVQMIPGVKHSERAYLGFLNKLRADVFESLWNDAKVLGRDPEHDMVLAKQIAEYVNDATGRGSLTFAGKNFERFAPLANATLFSPRFIASRIHMLTPSKYLAGDPFIRKQYLKSLGSIVGTGVTTLTLGKIAADASGGKASISFNPTDSDFLKLKVGNTRLDPWGGHQQYLTALARTVYDAKKTYYDKEKPRYGSLPAAVKFAYWKESPAASTVTRALFGRDPVTNQPVTLPDELMRNLVPMIAEDIWELWNDDPYSLPMIVPEFFGMGLQTYTRGGNIAKIKPFTGG